MGKQTETCSKKVRGRAQRSLDLIEAMYAAAEAAQPITGRGIGYKLFTARLMPSMAQTKCQPCRPCLSALGASWSGGPLGTRRPPQTHP
jgi:hypothetical protein